MRAAIERGQVSRTSRGNRKRFFHLPWVAVLACVAWPGQARAQLCTEPKASDFQKTTSFQGQQTYQGKTYDLGYEHCVSMAGSWFWTPGTAAKPVATVTGIYNSVRALNGNLLLNVPPDQTGQIPDAFVKRLNEIRDALKLDTTTTPTGLKYPPVRQGRFKPGKRTREEFNSLGQEVPGPAVVALMGLGAKSRSRSYYYESDRKENFSWKGCR